MINVCGRCKNQFDEGMIIIDEDAGSMSLCTDCATKLIYTVWLGKQFHGDDIELRNVAMAMMQRDIDTGIQHIEDWLAYLNENGLNPNR